MASSFSLLELQLQYQLLLNSFLDHPSKVGTSISSHLCSNCLLSTYHKLCSFTGLSAFQGLGLVFLVHSCFSVTITVPGIHSNHQITISSLNKQMNRLHPRENYRSRMDSLAFH